MTTTKKVVLTIALVLAVLHQDFWLWHDTTLVFGFIPVGLAYHAMYSILAACLWGLVVKFAWPEEVEAFASGEEEAPPA
jgi:hypothetical protein